MDCYRAYFAFGFYIDLIIALLIVIAVHALIYYQNFRASELAQSSLKTQLAQAQLRALKMQLHPHFLFNTLNAISTLVHKNPEAADRMIARLSDLLRLTLENIGVQEVRLAQEAAAHSDFVAVGQALDCSDRLEQHRSELGKDVRRRISVESRMRQFVSDVLG